MGEEDYAHREGAEGALEQEEAAPENKLWDAVVVGSGVIGLWSALYLARKGASVLVLERASGPNGSSTGNAGLLVPSRCKPLPGPGRIREGISGLFAAPGRPFRISPGLDPDLWGWLLRFALSCRRGKFRESADLLARMSQKSRELMEKELGSRQNMPFSGEGVLYPFFQRKAWIGAVHLAREGNISGSEASVLSARQAREAEPALGPDVWGAIHREEDSRVEPEEVLAGLQRAASRAGVRTRSGTRAYALVPVIGSGVKRVMTTRGPIRAEQVLLAAGCGIRELLHSLGLWLPLRSGTGWSITFPGSERAPSQGLLLQEERVAVSPWGGGFRVTGGLELGRRARGMDRAALQGVLRRARHRLPGLDYSGRPRVWQGQRPLTPDGLPIVGRVPGVQNLWVATGHANLGMTLGPSSGSLVADLMNGETGESWADALSPRRFLRK